MTTFQEFNNTISHHDNKVKTRKYAYEQENDYQLTSYSSSSSIGVFGDICSLSINPSYGESHYFKSYEKDMSSCWTFPFIGNCTSSLDGQDNIEVADLKGTDYSDAFGENNATEENNPNEEYPCENSIGGKETESVQSKLCCARGHWRPVEDTKLKELVALYGPQNWNLIAEKLEGRSGKSCRLRWFNQLDPRINRRAFSEEEEERLMAAHRLYGNKWAMIARLFPGRTDNAVKNHWHVVMARKYREQSSAYRRRKLSQPITRGLEEDSSYSLKNASTTTESNCLNLGSFRNPSQFPYDCIIDGSNVSSHLTNGGEDSGSSCNKISYSGFCAEQTPFDFLSGSKNHDQASLYSNWPTEDSLTGFCHHPPLMKMTIQQSNSPFYCSESSTSSFKVSVGESSVEEEKRVEITLDTTISPSFIDFLGVGTT